MFCHCQPHGPFGRGQFGLFVGHDTESPYDDDALLAAVAPRPVLIVQPTMDRDATPGVPKPYSGPGLGLPLIGRVVRAWGGQVSAERREGALVLGVDVPVR